MLAALDHHGFAAWASTEGTFTRSSFHNVFVTKVVPLLNPWPLPRSIVILDNAKIHMYRELEVAVHQVGARLLFLPPYCPELNPVELCFGSLKKWIQKHANLLFPLYPNQVLDVAMEQCLTPASDKSIVSSFYGHCGYKVGGLRDIPFDNLLT